MYWQENAPTFIAALEADGKGWLLEEATLADQTGPRAGSDVPVLLAVSDNGPQVRSSNTAQFAAIARIAQHFDRSGTPNDQAWIESFFGHLKG